MFGSHFQSSAHVLTDKFTGVLTCSSIPLLLLALMQKQVVAHATTYETLLNSRKSVYRMIDFKQRSVVGYEIRTNLRIDARGTLAHSTRLWILAVHSIHIGRGSAKVGQIALEVGHFYHLLHLLYYALLRTASYELALMGADGTESATAETSTMQIDRELNHIVSRNALALIFRVRQTRVWQVERVVEFFRCHRRIRRIDNGILAVYLLQQTLCVHLVRFLLDMTEIVGFSLLVSQTLLVAVQDDVVRGYSARYLVLLCEIYRLWNIAYFSNLLTLAELAAKFQNRFLAHSVDYHVGTRIAEDTLLQSVLPVVVMSQSAK